MIHFQEVIRRKKADFLRTEREIEEKLDETDKRKNGSHSRSRSSTPESNDNDSQVDARAEGQYFFFLFIHCWKKADCIGKIVRVIVVELLF